MTEVLFLRSGGGVVRVGGREVGRERDQFIGEMSFLTDATAAATVEVTASSRYVAWDRDQLRGLIAREPRLEDALLKSVTLNLVGKIQRANGPIVGISDAPI